MLNKLMALRPKGRLFVFSGPSGTGKTTLINMLCNEHPSIVRNISYTTRAPRGEEVDGVSYHFIDTPMFKKKIDAGEFLEYAEHYGYHYGTSEPSVQHLMDQGKHVVLVIDTQGGLQIRKKCKNAAFIFITAPTEEELVQRLEKRATECQKSIDVRRKKIEEELQSSMHYDYKIINENLQETYEILKCIFIAESYRMIPENQGE